jgi:hypothetical protein
LKSFSQSVRDAEYCSMNSPESFIGLKHSLSNRRSCPLGYTTTLLQEPCRILGHAAPLLGNDRKIIKYTTAITKLRFRKQKCFSTATEE